jgi:hypothetical protein
MECVKYAPEYSPCVTIVAKDVPVKAVNKMKDQ